MLLKCPYCGYNLPHPISHGISSCNHCNRVFDSSTYNCILSAAWLVRRNCIRDREVLVNQYGYDFWLADLVIEFVSEGACSHDEFVEVLKKLEIDQNYSPEESAVDIAS